MPRGILGEKCGSQVSTLESWVLGPLESQGMHSTASGCLKCKIFTPACCKELHPLGLKLGFLLNTDMCAHCARNQEGIKTPRWLKAFTSPAFRALSWLLPGETRVSGLLLLLWKIAVLKWATALDTTVQPVGAAGAQLGVKCQEQLGADRARQCSGKGSQAYIPVYPPHYKCHSKDLDLSTPTKKPKAVLSDNLAGTQRAHSKICK